MIKTMSVHHPVITTGVKVLSTDNLRPDNSKPTLRVIILKGSQDNTIYDKEVMKTYSYKEVKAILVSNLDRVMLDVLVNKDTMNKDINNKLKTLISRRVRDNLIVLEMNTKTGIILNLTRLIK